MAPLPPGSYARLPQTHTPAKMAPCVRFLTLGWRPDAISREIFIPARTIRCWESNLLRYGSPLSPRNRAFGRQELREAYIEEMKKYIAEDLVFLDEAIFNEKTGWGYRRVNAFNTPPIPLGVIRMPLWQQLHLVAGYPVQY
jgi:hypothetical protein